MDEFEDEDRVMRDDDDEEAVVGVLDGGALKPVGSAPAASSGDGVAASASSGSSAAMDDGDGADGEIEPPKEAIEEARKRI